jgi:pimeloyl-ACP methyl ester carboxylesterase
VGILGATFATVLLAPAQGPPQAVSFVTPDGWTIHADLYGAADRGVVLVHGGRFTKESWEKQARALVDAGFRVLAIDLRGYGQSKDGPESARAEYGSPLDVLAGVRYLHKNGVKTVSVVGGSMGGDAAAGASVEAVAGEIDRVVLLAARGTDTPERMKGRKLFITCRGDLRGDGELRLPGIRERYERVLDPKQLVILECSAHAQFIFATDEGPRLMQEILGFLSAP